MKKNILLALSFVLVAVLSIGATLALLTYEDSDHNTMTVGQAKIEQLELGNVSKPFLMSTHQVSSFSDPAVIIPLTNLSVTRSITTS